MAGDLGIIKDIPGYKVILKTVLKSQIQQLVQQLAANTDEESVILTASVSDGTISHLGSESGKDFLEEHEDIKSQFLGFCLKSQHRKIQQEDAGKLQKQSPQNTSPSQYINKTIPRLKTGGNVYPVGIHGASVSVRFQPYGTTSPRTTSQNVRSQSSAANQLLMKTSGDNSNGSTSVTVKAECDVDNSNQSITDMFTEDSGQDAMSDQSLDISAASSNKIDDSMTFISTSAVETLSKNADELTDTETVQHSSSADIESPVTVKLEPVTESEFDLEITGVEPGRHESHWDPNVLLGMNFDPTGATPVPATLGDPRTRFHTQSAGLLTRQGKAYQCKVCQKCFHSKQNYERHTLTHTGSKPFKCGYCNHRSARKDSLKLHVSLMHRTTALPDMFDENQS